MEEKKDKIIPKIINYSKKIDYYNFTEIQAGNQNTICTFPNLLLEIVESSDYPKLLKNDSTYIFNDREGNALFEIILQQKYLIIKMLAMNTSFESNICFILVGVDFIQPIELVTFYSIGEFSWRIYEFTK